MGHPLKLKFSSRLMLIDLPIVGFAIGAVFSTGLNLSKANSPKDVQSNAASCEEPTSVTSNSSWPSWQGQTCHAASTATPVLPTLTQSSAILSSGIKFLDSAIAYDQLRYSVSTPPPFRQDSRAAQSPHLDQIINGILARLQEQNYPTDSVSISLVDLTEDCCRYGQFQDTQKRYPASVVKLFWLVALYGQYEAGALQPNIDTYVDDEELMAHYSNNGASSRILDAITQTESGDSLTQEDLEPWIQARKSVNSYFLLAGYPDLNIAHKTFPVPDLAMEERIGRDLQFAEAPLEAADKNVANRNYLTTYTVARLLYEIETGQAISQTYSDRVKRHLRHSPDPAVWQYEDPNSIEGFFGEYLPPDAELYTKLGFTFDDGRQEAAIIASPDGKTRFILVVFANDPIYSNGESKIFPEIARYVYDQMQLRQTRS